MFSGVTDDINSPYTDGFLLIPPIIWGQGVHLPPALDGWARLVARLPWPRATDRHSNVYPMQLANLLVVRELVWKNNPDGITPDTMFQRIGQSIRAIESVQMLISGAIVVNP